VQRLPPDGVCIIQDDLTPVFEKIAAADVLAVASPIYSMGITAELKGLIDRSQYIWARKFILKNLYFTTEHMRRHKGSSYRPPGSGGRMSLTRRFPRSLPSSTPPGLSTGTTS